MEPSGEQKPSVGHLRAFQSISRSGACVSLPGLLPSNGPLPLIVGVSQVRYDVPDLSRTYLALGAEDRDGYVTRLKVDWGDGSPTESTEFPLSACKDPIKYWVRSDQRINVSHR